MQTFKLEARKFCIREGSRQTSNQQFQAGPTTWLFEVWSITYYVEYLLPLYNCSVQTVFANKQLICYHTQNCVPE